MTTPDLTVALFTLSRRFSIAVEPLDATMAMARVLSEPTVRGRAILAAPMVLAASIAKDEDALEILMVGRKEADLLFRLAIQLRDQGGQTEARDLESRLREVAEDLLHASKFTCEVEDDLRCRLLVTLAWTNIF